MSDILGNIYGISVAIAYGTALSETVIFSTV